MKKPNSQGAASATKAVGYARVSTPDQAEKDLSLPAQMSAIRRYAQDHGLGARRRVCRAGHYRD